MKRMRVNKRLLAIVFAIITIFSMNMVTAYAELTLNGTVDEVDWNYWFKDDSESPIVDVYWSNNSDYLCIGIVTDDTNENSDVLEFAFKASEEDYWIQIIPGVSTSYAVRASAAIPLFQGYWETIHTGLPTSVNAVAGKTYGNRSYEISIELSILGYRAGNLPESFGFWYKIQDGVPNGPINTYPDSYFTWEYTVPDKESGEGEQLPTFLIPEFPLGTIIALISMFLALAIFMKKPSFIPLLR